MQPSPLLNLSQRFSLHKQRPVASHLTTPHLHKPQQSLQWASHLQHNPAETHPTYPNVFFDQIYCGVIYNNGEGSSNFIISKFIRHLSQETLARAETLLIYGKETSPYQDLQPLIFNTDLRGEIISSVHINHRPCFRGSPTHSPDINKSVWDM